MSSNDAPASVDPVRVDPRIDQLVFYWQWSLWPRLQGLTDAEYRWSPVHDRAWDLAPGPEGSLLPHEPGPEAEVVPTIAWRMMHIAVGCFHIRTSTFFGDGSVPPEADMFDPRHLPDQLPGTAAGGLEFLRTSYQDWVTAVSQLTGTELDAPLGPRGGPFAESSMADLVLHLNREVMHHGGELGLLRDLWRSCDR